MTRVERRGCIVRDLRVRMTRVERRGRIPGVRVRNVDRSGIEQSHVLLRAPRVRVEGDLEGGCVLREHAHLAALAAGARRFPRDTRPLEARNAGEGIRTSVATGVDQDDVGQGARDAVSHVPPRDDAPHEPGLSVDTAVAASRRDQLEPIVEARRRGLEEQTNAVVVDLLEGRARATEDAPAEGDGAPVEPLVQIDIQHRAGLALLAAGGAETRETNERRDRERQARSSPWGGAPPHHSATCKVSTRNPPPRTSCSNGYA